MKKTKKQAQKATKRGPKPPEITWVGSLRSALSILSDDWTAEEAREAIDRSGSRRANGGVHIPTVRAWLRLNADELRRSSERKREALARYMEGRRF